MSPAAQYAAKVSRNNPSRRWPVMFDDDVDTRNRKRNIQFTVADGVETANDLEMAKRSVS